MGELQIRKIYIDTRFKTKDSKSNSEFKYELATSVSLPDNCVCFVDDVIIPNSWYTIDENNCNLYVKYYNTSTQTLHQRILTLTTNNYTVNSLKTELKTQLDAEFTGNPFTVTYNQDLLTYTLSVSSPWVCKIYTDGELTDPNLDWHGAPFSPTDLKSANEIFTNSVKKEGQEITTGIIDLRRYHNIYMSSMNLSSFTTMGARGENNIIKKIPVTVDYGNIIYDNVVANHDWVNVSRLLLKTLEFRLSDVYGNTIDLRGMPISFSLIFMIENE